MRTDNSPFSKIAPFVLKPIVKVVFLQSLAWYYRRSSSQIISNIQDKLMTTAAHDYARQNADAFRAQLHDLIRIPSVSTDSAYDADVRRAAEWLVKDLTRIGLTAKL